MLPFPINPRTAEYVIEQGGGGSFVGSNPPSNPYVGQLWWDNVAGNLYAWYDDGDSLQWVPAFAYAVGGDGDPGTGGGTFVGTTPPELPSEGTLWWDSVAGNLYVWFDDGDSQQWVPAFAYAVGGEGSGTEVGTTPPAMPTEGQLWWDSVAGNLYAWYDDGDSQQWVPAFAYAVGGGGAATAVGPAPPATPVVGQLWWDTVAGDLFMWYDDGDSSQWVSAFASAKAGAFAVGDTPPPTPVQGQPWFDSASGGLFMYYHDDDSSQWIGLTAVG